MQKSSQWLLRYRKFVAIGVHLMLFVLAQASAFGLRFDFSFPDEYFPIAFLWLGVNVAIRIAVFAWFGMFAGMWRYTGARDLMALAKSTALSSLLYTVFIMLAGFRSHPRSVLVIDFVMTMMFVGGLRFGVRSLWQLAASVNQKKDGEQKRRVLIVGAGNGGEMLVREMLRTHGGRYEPVGFVDDDKHKQGVAIHGVRVLGRITDAALLVERLRADEVVIAIPSATGQAMRNILDTLKPAGVVLRTIPGIDQLIEGRVTINQLRSVAIEDLLGREAVKLDLESLAALLKDQVVMVTGAGGSIGSELCRQIARFEPAKLLLVERSEPALFEIHRELRARFATVEAVPCIADITDRGTNALASSRAFGPGSSCMPRPTSTCR
jgi:FlaA1/EpsC-like NDP-sugar epimerase